MLRGSRFFYIQHNLGADQQMSLYSEKGNCVVLHALPSENHNLTSFFFADILILQSSMKIQVFRVPQFSCGTPKGTHRHDILLYEVLKRIYQS